MFRKFTALLFLCIISGLLYAQQAYPGASQLRHDDKEPFPKYIRFDDSQQLSLNEAMDWLRSNFRLDENTTFALTRINDDPQGWSHYRYRQLIHDIPVLGGEYIFHVKNDIVRSMNGELFSIDAPVVASLSKQQAIDNALRHVPAEKYGWETTLGGGSTEWLSSYPDPELIWVPENLDFKNGQFRLAYKMDIYAVRPEYRAWVFVDAQSGKIVAEENRICHVDVEGTVQTMLSGERTIFMDQVSDNIFRLRETTRGNGIVTLDMQNGEDIDNAVDFIHEDNDWGFGTPVSDRYGTDVHFGAQSFYDLLWDMFDRNSINEEGLTLRSYVHVGQNWANATWDGDVARFGDGNSASGLDLPVVSLDIVAHEFTHGLTDYTADLIYAYESGALNESFSDIFGLATNFYARPEASTWLIGPQSTSDGQGIRSASNPNMHGHPDTYKGDLWFAGTGDNGGVHFNSGVQNHWYYLLSEGGTGLNDNGEAYSVEGLGWEKALEVAYRNLSVYLTENSSFADAAYYGNQSAADLFGHCSPEYVSTVNAWHAVGLGQPVGDLTVNFQAQRYHCQTPGVVQFYNYSQPFESVLWEFGDGATSTEYSPVHVYDEEGVYDVKLTVFGCGGNSMEEVKQGYIVVEPQNPICNAYIMANTGTDTLTSCAGIVMDPGGTDDYLHLANSTLVIDPPTLGPLILTFTEFRLRGNNNDVDHLSIYDGPNTNAPLIGRFARRSLNGQTIQTSGGVVTLRFSTDNENDTTGFIMFYSTAEHIDAPLAGIAPSNLTPLLNEPVVLGDISQNPGHYFYDLGDGTTTNEAQPVHQYTQPGAYTVTQIITNCVGVDTTTVELLVQQGGALSVAPDSIIVTLNAGEQHEDAFVLQNSGPGDLYYGVDAENHPAWISFDAASGGIPNGQDVSIPVSLDASQLIAGTYFYDIPLESGDENQFSLFLHVKMIVLPFPQANIGVTIEDNCNGLFQFNDQTLNTPTSWLWDFGDGNTSDEPDPLYQYDENGVYDISLVACNDLGCDTTFQEYLVIVNYCDTLTMPLTGSAVYTNCNGVIYDDGGPDMQYSNNADFTVTIAPPNVDFVTLTFLKFQTQPITDVLRIYDGPDVNAPLIAAYSGTVTSGTQLTSTGNSITLHFSSNEALSFNGFEILWECSGSVPPTAFFTLEQDMDCDNTVYFEDASQGGTGTNHYYHWDLGNGFFVYDETSFTHHYTSSGVFTVTLEVGNALFSSSYQQEVTIPDTPFDLDMQLSADTIELGELVSFEAIVDFTPASYLWVPRPGDTLTTANPNYIYTDPGDFVVYLEVENDEGCKMWVQRPIHVIDISSVEEPIAEVAFQLSPNPSSGLFKLSLELAEMQQASIVLYNAVGQVLHQETFGQVKMFDKELNFSALPSGVYFLSLITEKGLPETRHLIIQR